MKILNLYLKIHAEFSKHSIKIVDKTLVFSYLLQINNFFQLLNIQ